MNTNIQSSHSHSHNSLLMERLLLRLVKKWAAGQDMKDALIVAKECNMKGQRAILNYLGEEYIEEERINRTTEEYSNLLDQLHAHQIDGCISIKPSQLGLCVSYELCLKNLRVLINRALKSSVFVWIDMESSKYTDDTLMLYLELFSYNPQIGVVIQSALRRSASDLLHLFEVSGSKVRLVKGAYHENEQIAFVHHEEVNANYIKLLEMLFNRYDNNNGVDNNTLQFAVATHDSKLIEHAIKLSKSSRNQIRNFEFEFLKGIRDELKRKLVKEGFRVAEYVPYGDEWLPYSVRRLRERKRNLLLLAHSLVQS
jgi:proline dehydrogenase